MKPVADLHIHSTYSDGALSPAEIMEGIAEKNLEAFSVTDHDSLGFYEEYPEYPTLIPGVELSTTYQNTSIHLLVYGLDPKNSQIRELARLCHEARLQRFLNLGRYLEEKCGFDVLEEAEQSRDLTTGFYARLLSKKGQIKYPATLYHRYFNPKNCPYVGYEHFPRFEELMKVLKPQPVFCILAHPGLKFAQDQNLLFQMKDLGLDGLEVMHPVHNRQQRVYFRRFCRQNNMMLTGGSDFHSRRESAYGIGRFGLDLHQWENLKQKWQAKTSYSFS